MFNFAFCHLNLSKISKKKAIITSGYFNPIHKGHIDYFSKSRKLGEALFVIVNNDFQRNLKGSKEFMSENERVLIVKNLRLVDKCFLSVDRDKTVRETIKFIFNQYGADYELVFANGGDQDNSHIPEKLICDSLGVELIDGLGEKIQSSSWLLNKK